METLSFAQRCQYAEAQIGISIDVRLSCNGETVESPVKLDTGATYSVFRRDLGEMLGIEIELGQEITIATVTGSFTAYGHDIQLHVMERDFNLKVFFAQDQEHPRSVLGLDWFTQVRIALVHYDRVLFVSHFDDAYA